MNCSMIVIGIIDMIGIKILDDRL